MASGCCKIDKPELNSQYSIVPNQLGGRIFWWNMRGRWLHMRIILFKEVINHYNNSSNFEYWKIWNFSRFYLNSSNQADRINLEILLILGCQNILKFNNDDFTFYDRLRDGIMGVFFTFFIFIDRHFSGWSTNKRLYHDVKTLTLVGDLNCSQLLIKSGFGWNFLKFKFRWI